MSSLGKHWKLSEKTKKNISKAMKGKIAWNKGIPRTEIEKKKISQTKKGQHCSVKTEFKKGDTSKEKNWNWKGGISPERQLFYSSLEWSKIVPIIWERDKKVCQRCQKKWDKNSQFHIHHKISFKNKELRVKLTNLILLCRKCHYWIHSKNNINKEFLK